MSSKGRHAAKKLALTAEQRLLYSCERATNYRWIAKHCGSRSPRPLTSADMADIQVHTELAAVGQFAEIAYAFAPVEYVFANSARLVSPGGPLEDYDALTGAELVCAFKGDAAKLDGYVARRSLPVVAAADSGASTERADQLLISFSGTRTLKQALYDMRFTMRHHPAGKNAAVHSGFWQLYMGVREHAFNALRAGFAGRDGSSAVRELVITGHSLGSAICYLLASDLLSGAGGDGSNALLPAGLTIKLATFGCPRVGNAVLAQCWQGSMNAYRDEHGEASFIEYSVKAYNDGIPSLPPQFLGYRHLCQTPLFLVHDRLYRIPAAEHEHANFDVLEELDGSGAPTPAFPRGGHNYYNGRDLEKYARHMDWLGMAMADDDDWEARYKALSAEYDQERRARFTDRASD